MGETLDLQVSAATDDLVRRALDELPEASVMVFDRSLRYVLVRGGAIEQAGLQRPNFEGRLIAEALPEARWAFYRPLFEAALRGENTERTVTSPSGGRRFLIRVGPILAANGDVLGGVALASDITREEAEAEAVAASEQRYRLLVDYSTDVIFQHAEGRLVWISPAVYTLLGWNAEELEGHTTLNVWHPDDLPRVIALRDAAYSGTPSSDVLRIRHKDGHYLRAELSLRPAPEHGHSGMVGTLRDVSARLEAEEALWRTEEKYRLIAENSSDVVILVGNDDRFLWVSPSARAVLGWEPAEVLGHRELEYVHLEDLRHMQEVLPVARAGVPHTEDYRIRRGDGNYLWVSVRSSPVVDADGNPAGRVAAVRDIHEVVQAERALAHAVDFDALTGLAKRSLALRWIDEVLQTRRSPDWALLCVGVDGMTAINQGYTYAAGDQVLQAVATRLVAAAGARDRVARVAGDEFVVLMRDITSATDAANAAERLAAAVRGPLSIDGVRLQASACIGIAMAGVGAAEELLRDASMAMRQAAGRGHDRWEFFDGDTGKRTRQELSTQLSLHEALQAGDIKPWLMPIANMRDGTVVGYEALARWVRDTGDVVTPDKFLDLAERTGQIQAIDRAMLTGVIAALSHIPEPLHVAVNIAASTLATGALDEWVRSDLLGSGVDPTRLHLEVTETALLRISSSITDTMRSLADLGISWWVDDFGTGFSSISHLRDLPVSGLKLDQSFTAGVLLPDSRASQLSRGLAGLATALGLGTVAEGVETEEQARVLAEQGWQLGQGWLYGRATPV